MSHAHSSYTSPVNPCLFYSCKGRRRVPIRRHHKDGGHLFHGERGVQFWVNSPAPLFPICGDPISPICQKSNSFCRCSDISRKMLSDADAALEYFRDDYFDSLPRAAWQQAISDSNTASFNPSSYPFITPSHPGRTPYVTARMFSLYIPPALSFAALPRARADAAACARDRDRAAAHGWSPLFWAGESRSRQKLTRAEVMRAEVMRPELVRPESHIHSSHFVTPHLICQCSRGLSHPSGAQFGGGRHICRLMGHNQYQEWVRDRWLLSFSLLFSLLCSFLVCPLILSPRLLVAFGARQRTTCKRAPLDTFGLNLQIPQDIGHTSVTPHWTYMFDPTLDIQL